MDDSPREHGFATRRGEGERATQLGDSAGERQRRRILTSKVKTYTLPTTLDADGRSRVDYDAARAAMSHPLDLLHEVEAVDPSPLRERTIHEAHAEMMRRSRRLGTTVRSRAA